MTPIAVYAGLMVLTGALSTLRSQAVRVDVRHVLGAHVALLLAETIRLALHHAAIWSPAALVLTLGTVASAVVRDWWYLSPADTKVVGTVVDESLGRLRFDATAEADGWSIRAGGVDGRLTLRDLPGPGVALRIRSEEPSPKVDLLRRLLAKTFEPLVPRLSIRTR